MSRTKLLPLNAALHKGIKHVIIADVLNPDKCVIRCEV